MADDIVTRLREQREDELMLGNDWLVDVLGGAADEIERLRAELQSYYDEDEEIRRGRSGE